MRGMFRFGCSSAYGPHSYSAQLPSVLDINTQSNDFRSFMHVQSSQYGPPQPGPTGRIYEIFPGVRADEAFDVAVFLVALAMVAAAVLGTCFFIAWFGNLKGSSVQQRGAYGMPVPQNAVQYQPTAVAVQPVMMVPQSEVAVVQPAAGMQSSVLSAPPAAVLANTVPGSAAPAMQAAPAVQAASPIMQTAGPVMQTSAPLPAANAVMPNNQQVYGPVPAQYYAPARPIAQGSGALR